VSDWSNYRQKICGRTEVKESTKRVCFGFHNFAFEIEEPAKEEAETKKGAP
jgi:hypothetical protein